MTDNERKMLEMAAKAAGVPLQWPYNPATYARVEGMPPRRTDTWDNWNPLTDDGDALRLAVTLRINIEPRRTMGGMDVGFNVWPAGRGDCAAVVDGNTEADLRLAITRAAAAIGESMP